MTVLLVLVGLLAVPAVEIAIFIIVGGWIGVLPTLALLLLTTGLGVILTRRQGLGVLRKIRTEIEAGRVPGREIADGAMVLAAGGLLILPGFLTDLIGLLLFVPVIREQIWHIAAARLRVALRRKGTGMEDRVIDLDAAEYRRGPDASSPWRLGRP